MTFAKAMREWLADIIDLVKLDLLQFFRNKLIVFSSLLTSVTMVLAFGMGSTQGPSAAGRGNADFTFILPGILGLGIMFSCTYTIGYAFIVDRQRRTIEDIVLSPLSYSGFLIGRVFGMVLKCSLQFLLVIVLAEWFFGSRTASYGALAFAFFTESLTFAGLGILVATVTNEVSFSILSNLFVIPLTYFCGVFFPIENFGSKSALIAMLPLAVHIDVFRVATNAQPTRYIAMSYGLSAAYAVAALLVAMYVFKRRVQNG